MRISPSSPWTNGMAPEPGTPIDWSSDHASGLVAFWPCWDGAGYRIQDIAGGFDATAEGNVAGVPPQYGASFDPGMACPVATFPAGNSYATYPNSKAFDLPAFTLSLWLKVNTFSSDNSGPFQTRQVGQNGFMFVTDTGVPFKAHLVVVNASNSEVKNVKCTTTFPAPFAATHHFLWTYDGTTPRLWIDGVEDVVLAGDVGYATQGNFLGRGNGAQTGQLSDVRVYNRARPELGTQLYDPSTRWDIFRPSRATIRVAGGAAVSGPVIGSRLVQGVATSGMIRGVA